MEAIENSLKAALQTTDNKIDAAVLRSLLAQGFDAQPRRKILVDRKFEDDIRLCDGDHHVSIEVENYGNRLEFDLLKMMTFAEAVPEAKHAWGCLIVPAYKELKNPYISGNGRELMGRTAGDGEHHRDRSQVAPERYEDEVGRHRDQNEGALD